MNVLIVALLAVTKSVSGLIGVSRCSVENWTILFLFTLACVAISKYATKKLKYE